MSVTSVNIDPELLSEAKAALHLVTTKDTITQALREVVLRRQQQEALDGLALIDFDLQPTKLDYDDAS